MNSVRVYDLPTRIFHWSFAALFMTAYAIANLVDDEASRFAWHMLAGLMLLAIVLFRLVWGLVGTRHALFTDFSLRPRELVRYLQGVVRGGGHRWIGHNPASSWAALTMMVFALVLGGSGIAMTLSVAPHWVEEAHEVVANSFLVLVALHLAGIAVHLLRHHDALPASMISGRKRNLPVGTQTVAARGVAAALMAAYLIGAGGLLLNGFSPAERTLSIFGTQLSLGEDRNESHNGGESRVRTSEDENREREVD